MRMNTNLQMNTNNLLIHSYHSHTFVYWYGVQIAYEV